jgi:hypothetical protein
MDKPSAQAKVVLVVMAVVIAASTFAFWIYLPYRPAALPGTDVWLDGEALVPVPKPQPQVQPPPGPPPVPSYPTP